MSAQQQQQLGLQQQLRLMRLLVKIIKANGLADGDFGININVLLAVFVRSVPYRITYFASLLSLALFCFSVLLRLRVLD